MTEKKKPIVNVGYYTDFETEYTIYRIHSRGTPLDEAKAFADIMAMGELNQRQIGNWTGLEQSDVSDRLSLLKLSKTLRHKLVNREMSPSAGYELARFPPKKQKHFETMEKIRLADVRNYTAQESSSLHIP